MRAERCHGPYSLSIPSRPPFRPRLALIEHTHEWVVYHVNAQQQPVVQLRQPGFAGLQQAILLFRSKM